MYYANFIRPNFVSCLSFHLINTLLEAVGESKFALMESAGEIKIPV